MRTLEGNAIFARLIPYDEKDTSFQKWIASNNSIAVFAVIAVFQKICVF